MEEAEAYPYTPSEQAIVRHAQGRTIAGAPEQVRERLQGFVDVGVRDFILRFADFPRMDGARRFAEEIAPKLKA